MANLEADVREVQVEVRHLTRDRDILMQFRDEASKLIAERMGGRQKEEARSARAVRAVTLIGGTLGIISTVGVIIGALV